MVLKRMRSETGYKIFDIYGAGEDLVNKTKMIGRLSLVAMALRPLWATDGGGSLYPLLSPNTPLFDQGFMTPIPQAQSVGVSGGKPGQLLSFTADGGLGGGHPMQMSPIALQPPGNVQYANVCDLSEKKEQFKKCLTDQLSKFKNILENCRKTLGEDAKECCIDEKCLDLIRGKDSSCSDESSKGACKDKRYREKILDEIVSNLNVDKLRKSLLDSLKGSLKKLGGKLGGLGGCGGEDGDDSAEFGGSGGLSSIKPGKGTGIPPGVLMYPIEQSKYEAITSILDGRQGPPRQRDELSSIRGNPDRYNGDRYNGKCSPGDRSERCPPERDLRDRWRYRDDQGIEDDREGRGGSSNDWRDDTVGSSRGRPPRDYDPPCTKEMCTEMDRYDSPDMREECVRYCKDYRSRNGKRLDEKREKEEEVSDLTSDSCYEEKK